jgi:hypothetical protein
LLTMGSGPTVARIAIGASGYVLTSDGTDAAWAAPAATITSSDADLVLAMQVFG